MKKKALCFLLFIICLLPLVIPFVQCERKNIEIRIYLDDGDYISKSINADKFEEIEDGLDFPVRSEGICTAEVYGYFKTMPISVYESGKLWNYILLDESIVEKQYEDGKIYISSENDSVKLYFTDEFIDMLEKDSRSYVQESMILILILAIVCSVIVILINNRGSKDQKYNNHMFGMEVKRFFGDVVKYKEYITYSAKTDMNAEVANSKLNMFWWILEPLMNMVVYVVVFGTILGSSIEHFSVYVFSALLMWNYFCRTMNTSVQMVRSNKDTLSRIYLPKFVMLLSQCLMNFYKLIFSFVVLIPMLLIFKVHFGIGLIGFVLSYCGLILFTFGLGVIVMHLGVFVDDLAYSMGILLNMLMFVSGVLYNVMTTLPQPLDTVVLSLNPISLFIDTMRQGLLYNRLSNIPFVIAWIIMSCILIYYGVHTVYKNENGYIKVI